MNSAEIVEQHCAARALVGSPLLDRGTKNPEAPITLDATPPTEHDAVH